MCDVALGASEGGRLTDAAFTASSTFPITAPARGRLNNAVGWMPATAEDASHLQVDLGSSFGVCAIATQGIAIYPFHVTTYTLSFSLDGVDFQDVTEGGIVKVTRSLKTGRKEEMLFRGAQCGRSQCRYSTPIAVSVQTSVRNTAYPLCYFVGDFVGSLELS